MAMPNGPSCAMPLAGGRPVDGGSEAADIRPREGLGNRRAELGQTGANTGERRADTLNRRADLLRTTGDGGHIRAEGDLHRRIGHADTPAKRDARSERPTLQTNDRIASATAM